MTNEIHGTADWPGALGIESCNITLGHGIAPATAMLVMQPQDNFPEQDGTLTISDGDTDIVLPGCRMDNITATTSDSGVTWNCTIVDRRWRWRDLGLIQGWYNQLDPQGKLIPQTIRSPTELATLCLEEMGEEGYELHLPPGLDSSAGQGIVGFLPTGVNFPPTGVNPQINWVDTPPAQALSQVAEMFGCRVVYRVSSDSVLVTPNGIGADLPDGSVHKQTPSIKSPETPDAVGVLGDPTRYQVRLSIEPVGLEWDRTYRPINDLSYAPVLPGAVQITTGTIVYDGVSTVNYQMSINGIVFSVTGTPGNTATTIAANLVALINADPRVSGVLKASAAGGVLTLTGKKPGTEFTVQVTVSATGPVPAGNSFEAVLTQVAAPGGPCWFYALPPTFAGVTSTPRLTLAQAQQLAQQSVWRCFRVVNGDASDNSKPINVPGYGTVQNRQQLVISNTQVDQVTPQPGDEHLRDAQGDPFLLDMYQGFSKDKRAVVYGEVALQCFGATGIYHQAVPLNTAPGTLLPFQVSVNSDVQVVTFGSYLYHFANSGVGDPELTLQCAVQVRDPDTNQLVAFLKVVPLPGQNSLTNPRVEHHADVQLNVTSTYDTGNNVTGVSVLEADPILRANYYLVAMTAKYRASGAQSVEYNGIVDIDMDGAISQVSWSVGGGGGASTTASRNTEHDPWVPPYPTRRRAELLDAVERRENKYGRPAIRTF